MLRPRYVCVIQNDQSDCGAAVLATVALHHGLSIGLEKARELTGTDRVGTNLLAVLQAAERVGFAARAAKGGWDVLAGLPLPAILHVTIPDGVHFVVVHAVRKDRILVADPAIGLEWIPRAEFERKWTGYLLVLVPKPSLADGLGEGRSVSPGRRFAQILLDQRGLLLEAFACALFMTSLGVATSYFVKHLVDFVLVRGEGRLLDALGVGMVLLLGFRTLFGLLRQYLLAHLGRRVDLLLVSAYARHLLKLPIRFFENRRVGEILSRVHDAVKIREAVSGAVLTTLVDGSLVLAVMTVIWFYDVRLALAATGFVPVLLASVALHHGPTRRRSNEMMENAAGLHAHFVEDLEGIETIKAFGLEADRAAAGEDRLVRVVQSAFSLQKIALRMNGVGVFVTGLAGIVVLWYGGHRVLSGAISIGELLFVYTLLGTLLGPLEQLATVNLQFQDAIVAIDRLYQILDSEVEAKDAGAPRAGFRGLKRSIVFEGVSFRYGSRDPVLEGIDLEIPAGSTVAFVGESGSGKSTLFKLLLRFHDPVEGRVLIDGVDSRDLDVASLRSRIGFVSQEPYLFNGSIRDNIALGASGVSLEQVTRVAKAAGIARFVDSLPSRYETLLGERGTNLSGGQRQRLAIARALLRRPDVLLFDEATSHLDTGTEQAILASLRTRLAGRTVLMIAHRLSTIRTADRICYVHKGRIAEEGTHESLLALGGRYAKLWSIQVRENGTPGTRTDRRPRRRAVEKQAGGRHA